MESVDGRLSEPDEVTDTTPTSDARTEEAYQDATTVEREAERKPVPAVAKESVEPNAPPEQMQSPPSFGRHYTEPADAAPVVYCPIAQETADLAKDGPSDEPGDAEEPLTGPAISPTDRELADRSARAILDRAQGKGESEAEGMEPDDRGDTEDASQIEAGGDAAQSPEDDQATSQEEPAEDKADKAAEPESPPEASAKKAENKAAEPTERHEEPKATEESEEDTSREKDPELRDAAKSEAKEEQAADDSSEASGEAADKQAETKEAESSEGDSESEPRRGAVISRSGWLSVRGVEFGDAQDAGEEGKASDRGAEASQAEPVDTYTGAPASTAEEDALKRKVDEILSDIDKGIMPEVLEGEGITCRKLSDDEVAKLFPQGTGELEDVNVVAIAGKGVDAIWNGLKKLSAEGAVHAARGVARTTTFLEGYTSQRVAYHYDEAMAVDLVRDDAKAPVVSQYYLMTGRTGMRTIFGERKDPPQLWRSLRPDVIAARAIYQQVERQTATAVIRNIPAGALPKGTFATLMTNLFAAYRASIGIDDIQWRHYRAAPYRTRTRREF